MSTQSASNRVDIVTMQSSFFERFAGLSAILVGITGLLYSISFVLLKNDLLIALFLMLGGVFSTAVLVAVYNRLKETDATFALWALLLSFVSAFGAIIHAGLVCPKSNHPTGAAIAAAD